VLIMLQLFFASQQWNCVRGVPKPVSNLLSS